MKKPLLVMSILIFTFTFSSCRFQITPLEYLNTKWASMEPNIYFEVFEEKAAEGELVFNDVSIRIYVAWIPGSQCITIFDADKQDADVYYDSETVLLYGSGHWESGQYIVEVIDDYIGLNTTEIVFSKEQ